MENNSFIIALKRIKYLRVILIKKVNPYTEDYETLMKDIEDRNK